MKAAVLEQLGQPLVVKTIPEPEVIPGSVKVKTLYSGVGNGEAFAFSGKAPLPIPVPLTPGAGAIGYVEECAPDVVTGLTPNQLVFCSPYYLANTGSARGVPPAGLITGMFMISPTSGGLWELWKDGGYSEKSLWPASCVFPLPDDMKKFTFRDLFYIKYLAISMGAVSTAKVGLGSHVLVNGATGRQGAGAVKLALALGAEKVYAVGRNPDKLRHTFSKLRAHIEDKRLVLVSSDEEIPEREVDSIVDFIGFAPDPTTVMRCWKALRHGGTLVCAGGMMGNLEINYAQLLMNHQTVTSSLMYTDEDVLMVIDLIRTGRLNIQNLPGQDFSLDFVNDALPAAAADSAQFVGIRF